MNPQELFKAVMDALASKNQVSVVAGAPTQVPLLAVPDGVKISPIDEKLLDAPLRTRGTTRLHEYGAFTAYVNKYKGADAMVFVSPSIAFTSGGVLANAVLDFPGRTEPSWSTHTAELVVEPSLEYKLLTSLDGKLLEQDEFSRLLLKVSKFCTTMSSADLLEMAQKLTLTSKGQFRSINDDLSGSINLAYDVQVNAKVDSTTTKTLEVPQHIGFNLPMLLGGEPVSLVADFKYRLPEEAGGKIKLGIALPDRQYVERDVLEALVAQLSGDTSLPVAVGTSTVPHVA